MRLVKISSEACADSVGLEAFQNVRINDFLNGAVRRHGKPGYNKACTDTDSRDPQKKKGLHRRDSWRIQTIDSALFWEASKQKFQKAIHVSRLLPEVRFIGSEEFSQMLSGDREALSYPGVDRIRLPCICGRQPVLPASCLHCGMRVQEKAKIVAGSRKRPRRLPTSCE